MPRPIPSLPSLFGALLLVAATAAAGELPDPLANVDGRTTTTLDGTWRTIVDPYGAGLLGYHGTPLADGYFADPEPRGPGDRVEVDFDTSPTLKVPGDWNSQRPELFLYEGPLWYRQLFEHLPGPDRRTFLHFGAVNRTARIYLNGEEIGRHEGGFTPFAVEITRGLRSGENSLVVLADSSRHRDAIPTLMTDWWNYGGITRSVRLVDVPRTFVRDYFLRLEPGSEGWVRARVRLDGPRKRQEVRIRIPEAGIEAELRTGGDGVGEARFRGDALERWSPESPRLYEVEIVAETDAVSEAIGFRTVEVRGSEILLNGEPIFLRGISIHEEAPMRGGRAVGRSDARTLLGWARHLGANFVRLAHYPHDESMVREADRAGLLVWSEIPVYWTISWENPETLESARRQLAEMVLRDRNRASVVLWSVANETPVGPARNAFLESLVGTVRGLDPSRLVTAALEARAEGDVRIVDDPIGELLDVMGTNEYIGWYDGPPEKCDRIEWRTRYDKPLIMSELGGGALAGRHGDAGEIWTEEFQARLYEHQIGMLRRIPFLAGVSPWILMDFRSPRRPLPVIQDFWNRKGLLSERGQRKKAFFVLREYYRELAEDGELADPIAED